MDKDKILSLAKWVVILVITLLLLKECRSIVGEITGNSKPGKDSIITITRDSILPKDTVYVFKPKWYPTPAETILVPIDTSGNVTRFFRYKDTLNDKNVDIYTDITTQGILKSSQVSYKLKVPLMIIDSVKIKVSEPKLYPPVFQIHAGIIVGRNLLAPEIGVSHKRSTFGIGYNLLDKMPTIRYSYTLYRK